MNNIGNSLSSQKNLNNNRIKLVDSLNNKIINFQKQYNLHTHQIQNLRKKLENNKTIINTLEQEKQQLQEKINFLKGNEQLNEKVNILQEKQQLQGNVHTLEKEKQQFKELFKENNPVKTSGFIFLKS